MRIISATNANLVADVERGLFRKDLLFRLNTVELRLPALRERGEDIALLAESFLSRFGQRYHRDGLAFSPSALSALARYHWPGNVRELSHAIERAVLMTASDQIDGDALGLKSGQGLATDTTTASSDASATAAVGTIGAAEEQLVRGALQTTGGNIQRAAVLLGLSRPALYRRMEKYGIP
ncbi:MAG: helix-turn-helix domain-containing protein [Dokdonella sp.]